MEGQGGEATKSSSAATKYVEKRAEASKQVMQEDGANQSENVLDLKLWSANPNPPPGSSRKLDLFASLGADSSKTSSEPKAYYCNYCGKKFHNCQALGGHQNAHKYERSLVTKKSDLDFSMLSYPHYSHPCSGMPPFPATYGSCNNPLGVQMHSKIHKPFHPWSHVGSRYEHGGWSRPSFYPNPEMDYPRCNYFHANNGGSHDFSRIMGFDSPLTTTNGHENNVIGSQVMGGTTAVSNQQMENAAHAPSMDSTPVTASNNSHRDVPSLPMESLERKEKNGGGGGLDLSLKL